MSNAVLTAIPAERSSPRSPVEQDAIDIKKWVSMLRRHPRVIAITFVVIFTLVAGVRLTAPKAYTAVAQVQVNIHERNAADILPDTPSGDSALSDSAKVETDVELLQSRSLAEDVMKHLPPASRKSKAPGPLGALVRSIVELVPHPPKDPVADFLKPLEVSRIGQSYVIGVSYTADDPDAAAQIANTFVSRFQQHRLATMVSQTNQANAWLNTTLAQLATDVRNADAAVAAYRTSHNLSQAGNSTMSEQTISGIGQQLVAARAAQAEAEARYGTAKAQVAAGSNGGDVGEALASTVVSQLRAQRAQVSQSLTDLTARYGPKHPDVVKTTKMLADLDAHIQAEITRILSNLRAQAEIARERTASLQVSLRRANAELGAGEEASVTLNDLMRKQDAARTAYQDYLNRYKRTSAQQDLPQNETSIVTQATPDPKPTSPKVPTSLALAFASALIGATGAMFTAEALQKGFSETEELERVTGLRSLPSIPSLGSTSAKRGVWSGPTDYVVERPLSVFAEAFRTLRASVLSSRIGEPVQVVAITSALPAEGKTTTSICFGRVAALGDTRTVIIDCDLRRRSFDKLIGRRAKVGLLEVLHGTASLESALVRDTQSGAYLLPLGAATDAHRNVFESEAMDALLEALRQRFELIILDSAPALALADARVIAAKADVTVLLACWQRTPRSLVEEAARELRAVGGRLAGIALTQVDLRKQRAFQYGKGSIKYYKQYGGYFTD